MTEIFSQLIAKVEIVTADLLASNFGLALILIGQGLLMAVFLLLSAYFLIYADRKIWAAVQLRRGPNVVGAFGLLQSGADMLKLVFKEIVVPAGSDKFVFFLAPIVSFVMAILAWAVIPLNDGWQLSNLNVAILYVFAISSLEVYGVIMGGARLIGTAKPNPSAPTSAVAIAVVIPINSPLLLSNAPPLDPLVIGASV